MSKDQVGQLRKGEYIISRKTLGERLLESATQAVDSDEPNKSCIRGPHETTEEE